MIVCVAVEEGKISTHFGNCPEYAFFLVEEDETQLVKTMPNPGHTSRAVPSIIREWGVTHVIAGAMGPEGVEMFESLGVEVFTGASGEAEDAVRALAAGELVSKGAGCGGHDHGHEHEHGHGCGCH